MERAAFKIPLRPNPSTLPNVFPTILHEHEAGPLSKQTEKLFSFYPFSREPRPYLINMRACPRRTNCLSDSLLLLTCWKRRADQTFETSGNTRPFFFFFLPWVCLKQGNQSHPRSKPLEWLGSSVSTVHPVILKNESRRCVLCGVLPTAWAQTGLMAASGIWIKTG